MVASEAAQTMSMATSPFSASSKDSEGGEVPNSVMEDIDDCDGLGGFSEGVMNLNPANVNRHPVGQQVGVLAVLHWQYCCEITY